MRARELSGLLKKGDRVALSNITGREASQVTVVSQQYSDNIVGGWALGKGGQTIEVPGHADIPVFGTCEELYASLPKSRHPNKVIIYSPPEAVYGEVKESIQYGGKKLQTIFVITEHVSIEVTAKIRSIARDAGVDVIGCNTLGVINTHDRARVGAVGGDTPSESFRPGSSTIISNSGNMVNTIASYMQTAGVGNHFGISTGKDVLILTPLVDFMKLVARSEKTKLVILYVEPGGRYEEEALKWMRKTDFDKPVLVYVAGTLSERNNVSLGHAGAVVEGQGSSASGKMAAFDEYFGCEPFDPNRRDGKNGKTAKMLFRGIRVTTLHHLPAAAMAIYDARGWKRDFPVQKELTLNPWFVAYHGLAEKLPGRLLLRPGKIPEPYNSQFARQAREGLGLVPPKRDMSRASHASALEKDGQCIYGYRLTELMTGKSFGESVILYWTGQLPRHAFEARLFEMCLTASLTNGPGTISAQGAKLSASASNAPNVGMIATLASIGDVHGGNGRRAVRFLLKVFRDVGLKDPYGADPGVDVKQLARDEAERFGKIKAAAKDAGVEYERLPGLGHPVFNKDPVNHDPRERTVSGAMERLNTRNVFLDFYHELARELHEAGVANRVWAVNMDATIAAVVLGTCWVPLMEKRITVKRVEDCAFLTFALGRAAGGAGEFLDHQDFGSPMDMRIPADECNSLTRQRPLPDASS